MSHCTLTVLYITCSRDNKGKRVKSCGEKEGVVDECAVD